MAVGGTKCFYSTTTYLEYDKKVGFVHYDARLCSALPAGISSVAARMMGGRPIIPMINCLPVIKLSSLE